MKFWFFGNMYAIRTVVVLVHVFVSFINAQSDLCTTPRQKSGECKIINECAPLFSILQHRPISPGDADYLRRSQCGFEGTLPKVCCPYDSSPPEPTPTQPPPPPPNTGGGDENNNEGDLKPVNNNLLPNTSVCGLGTQDRIYGGEKAELDEFPWMALIEYERPNRQRGFYCGGVLISQKYILTAAHCVKGKDLPKDWKLVSVRLGEYNTETEQDCINNGFTTECAPPPVDVPVEERIAHEDYNPYDTNQYHDIAVLRLIRNVKYTEFIKPICLPTSVQERRQTYTGKKLSVAGWGKTENRSESNIKLKLQVPVKSGEDCTKTYSAAFVKLNDGQLCAGGEKGKDSCRGDSGGPLMTITANQQGDINWYAVGVVSFGPSPCGMENWPGVYTRVAKYVPWISSKIRP